MSTARVRNTDPKTSHEAAAWVRNSGQAQRLELAIYEALRGYEQGLTTEELSYVLPFALTSITPRMKPMEEKGMVYRAGKTKLRSGRHGIIWKANLEWDR